MTRLWVDDRRKDPDTALAGITEPLGWVWAKTSGEAIEFLQRAKAKDRILDEVSLDHDLGYVRVEGKIREDRGTYVLNWMITYNYWPKVLTIHTANVVARDNMLRAANVEAPEWVDIRYIIR